MNGTMTGSDFLILSRQVATLHAALAEPTPKTGDAVCEEGTVTHEPRFYTGCITIWARVRPDGLTPVRITRAKPRFADDVTLTVPELMVPWRRVHMLSQNLSWEQFVAGERARLRQVGAAKISKQLAQLHRRNGQLILLDWTARGLPAGHSPRRVFADWFEEQTGEPVPEYSWHHVPAEPERQLVLV